MIFKYAVGMVTAIAVTIAGFIGIASAKVEGDTITLGSSISLTGK